MQICQSDMTSAFYLFALPEQWAPYLTFDLSFSGKTLGLEDSDSTYYLSCRVLPMGWSSAVGVMQELSTNLLRLGGLPEDQQIVRNKPLPAWMVAVLNTERNARRGWWHIYLDNFFAGEKVRGGQDGADGKSLHDQTEKIWESTGVLSSKKKKVSMAGSAEELGGLFSSREKYLGVSGERLLKVCQTTLVVAGKRFLPKKWIQVACGRWVHVLQFRRAGMVALHEVWKLIGNKRRLPRDLAGRAELVGMIQGACLFHTFLGAPQSKRVTASDASGTGGAVGSSDVLQWNRGSFQGL